MIFSFIISCVYLVVSIENKKRLIIIKLHISKRDMVKLKYNIWYRDDENPTTTSNIFFE